MGVRDDSEGNGDRTSERLSGTCVVEFYSTPFLFLTDTITGKILCVSDLGRRIKNMGFCQISGAPLAHP